jgi:hypothetical protein
MVTHLVQHDSRTRLYLPLHQPALYLSYCVGVLLGALFLFLVLLLVGGSRSPDRGYSASNLLDSSGLSDLFFVRNCKCSWISQDIFAKGDDFNFSKMVLEFVLRKQPSKDHPKEQVSLCHLKVTSDYRQGLIRSIWLIVVLCCSKIPSICC